MPEGPAPSQRGGEDHAPGGPAAAACSTDRRPVPSGRPMFAIPLHERLRYDTHHSPARGAPADALMPSSYGSPQLCERGPASSRGLAVPTRYPREQMHRIRYTKLTPEQIGARLSAAANGPVSASSLSEALAGRSLRIVLDNGPALGYRFADRTRLSLSEGEAAAVQAGYGALVLDRLVLFSHMVPRTQRGYTVVIDQETNLATVFEVWFSGYEDNREVQRQIYYGYIEQAGGSAPEARHGITNRIEGKGFYWKQDTGVETL